MFKSAYPYLGDCFICRRETLDAQTLPAVVPTGPYLMQTPSFSILISLCGMSRGTPYQRFAVDCSFQSGGQTPIASSLLRTSYPCCDLTLAQELPPITSTYRDEGFEAFSAQIPIPCSYPTFYVMLSWVRISTKELLRDCLEPRQSKIP